MFHIIDEDMMKKLIEVVIHPRLEYTAVVGSPHIKKNIRKIERIQRSATKMMSCLRLDIRKNIRKDWVYPPWMREEKEGT